MRRIIASLGLALFFCLTPASQAASVWTLIAQKLTPSVYYLEALDKDGNVFGSCTGFAINQAKGYFLTASHCDGEKVRIAGTASFKMFKDERKDLMVLRAINLDLGPAIKLAKTDPDIGTAVASIGYGFGLEQPMFRLGNISHTRIEIEELSGPFVMIDANYVPGQSGGPVLNDQGELVSIVQRGAAGFGFGVGVDTIRDRVGRYFE
jgi:S1-C subfamily serine protease